MCALLIYLATHPRNQQNIRDHEIRCLCHLVIALTRQGSVPNAKMNRLARSLAEELQNDTLDSAAETIRIFWSTLIAPI